ncbi:MAG: hypothetical protein J6D57_06660, partial [Mogibacterium sp.]|nr:hypothetical protein [Mogibacterium sp.]
MAKKRKASKTDNRIEKKREKSRRSKKAVRSTGLDDKYAYGSFDFDEYGKEAFSRDGYEYRGRDTGDARMDAKRDLKRDRIRREADTSRITPLNRSRLVLGFAVILLLMTALIFRMGYWQIVRADELRTMAVSMQKVDTELD